MVLPTPPEPLDLLYLLNLSILVGILDALLAKHIARGHGWGDGAKAFYPRRFAADSPYANAMAREALALAVPVVYGVATFVGLGGCVARVCLPELHAYRPWDLFLSWWAFLGWVVATTGLVLEDYTRCQTNRPHRIRSPEAKGARAFVDDLRLFGTPVGLLVVACIAYFYSTDPDVWAIAGATLGFGAALLVHQLLSSLSPTAAGAVEPRRSRASPFVHVSERKAASVALIIILFCLLTDVGWTWSGTSVGTFDRMNTSGILTLGQSTRLSVYARDFDAVGDASAGASSYAPNIVVNGAVPSFLFFDQPAPAQRVVVSNRTQTVYDQVAADFELNFLNLSSCDIIVVNRAPYELSTALENPLVLELALSTFAAGPSLTVYGYQGSSGILANLVVLGAAGDVMSMRCLNPAFTVNGTQFSYAGSYFLTISGFTGLRGTLWLWEQTSVDLNGDWTLRTGFANATLVSGSGAAWTDGGEARPVRGNMTVLDASSLALSQSVGLQGSGVNVLGWSQKAGYTYIDAGSAGTSLLGSTSYFAPNVADASWRWAVTILSSLSGAVILLVVLWIAPAGRVGGEGNAPADKAARHTGRDSLRNRVARATTVVVGLVLLGTCFAGYGINIGLGNLAPPYFYSRYPATFDVWYESGVNTEFASMAVSIFLWEAERYIGIHIVGIVNHAFDGEGPREYNLTDPDLWFAGGRIGLNRAEVWSGSPIPLRITFLTGTGNRFAGVDNNGPSIVVFPGMYSTTLSLVTTLLHEFGHALGFAHDSCSPIMTNDTATNIRLSLSAYNLLALNASYRGVQINEAILNETFSGFPDWGTLVGRADDVSNQTLSDILRTTDSLVYFNPGNNSLHEVLWERDANKTSGSVGYSSMVFTAPPNVFLMSWSTAEQVYVQQSLAGFPASSPAIGQC